MSFRRVLMFKLLARLVAFSACTLTISASDIVLSELMASNHRTIQDEDGTYADWLELYNNSSNTVGLAGWHLTNIPEISDLWTFPAATLAPGAYPHRRCFRRRD